MDWTRGSSCSSNNAAPSTEGIIPTYTRGYNVLRSVV